MKKMSDKKLSSDEVPQKFIEWLLAMGCPAEKILSMEKMNEMCRGQYYMIWRCLMEHVEAKELLKFKLFHSEISIKQHSALIAMKKMSDKKLSSDEVPQKFIEWLLAMGCPAEKILSMEKMNEMCRGQYYMIWRCLMEHVEAKEVIKHKRLTVFCDNVKQCQEKKLLDEKSSSSMLPEQLSLWMKHRRVKEKVAEAEARVNEARAGLNGLMDKVSSKVIQRNTLRQHIANLQRRCWLLGQVSDELATKIANLEETKTIADSLCIVEKEQHDIPSKLDKCIALLQQKRKTNTSSLATPVASSSILSYYENETSISVKDEYVLPLVNCRGDVLWPHLYEKLTSLCSKLSEASTTHVGVGNNRTNTQSMLAHTAALQSTLALEAIKNKVNIQRKQQEIIESSDVLTIHLPENEVESLLLKAQRAYSSARLRSLKSLLQQLGAGSGVFRCAPGGGSGVDNAQAARDSVARVDRCIIKSMGEINRLMSLSAIGERKIYNIRECLLRIFTAFHNDSDIGDDSLARGVQINFPTESISLLRQFYKKRWEDANVSNLSFDLELSDILDNSTFVDELNVYLKEFNLEKNRKIVLDNGENVWVFGTVQALRSRLLARWVQHGVTALLHPSLRVSRALRRLCDSTRLLLPAHRTCDEITTPAADIAAIASYEAETVDKLKKSIAENLNVLHKTRKNLEPCEEILHFWSGRRHVAYIATDRRVDGKTYREYEALYKEKLVASNRCY